MQLRRMVAGLGCAALLGGASGWAQADAFVEPPRGGALLRLFSDSERIQVRSWIGDYDVRMGAATLALHLNHERVIVPAIAAAPGTAEAVDAITTASRPIAGNAFQDFLKLRNELQGELRRGGLAVHYYHSLESDYVGQQIGGRATRDFLEKELNVSVGASFGYDTIDPLADDDTQTGADHKATWHGNIVATRVVSPTTMVRGGLEINRVSGLQHNPYRNVFAGGSIVPERHPEDRMRADAFLRVHQYLPNRSSLKIGYRLYQDDWGIRSHEADARLSQYVSRGGFVRYQYRYYTQGAAEFYRGLYTMPTGIDGYRTGDYRMGPLASHLFGVTIDADLGSLAPRLRAVQPLGLFVGYERYFNSNNYSADILEAGIDVRF